MSMWVRVVTLVFAIICVSVGCRGLYEIPAPEIVAFTTGGLRITIPEEPGISEFRFHGNVNEEIQPLRPGTINMDTHQQTRGKWILENKHTSLKIGDYIYYWIFVKNERLGYVRQPQFYIVNELVPYFVDGTLPSMAPPASYFPRPQAPWNPVAAKPIDSDAPCSCNNSTQSLTSLKNQVESLTKTVDLLKGIVEKLPDANKLTLNGRIPKDENPAATARFILWDKLDLKPKIVSAVRNDDGSITFELKTLEEKIEVLKLVQEKLVDSRVSIY